MPMRLFVKTMWGRSLVRLKTAPINRSDPDVQGPKTQDSENQIAAGDSTATALPKFTLSDRYALFSPAHYRKQDFQLLRAS